MSRVERRECANDRSVEAVKATAEACRIRTFPTVRSSNHTWLERSRPKIDSESGRVAFQRRLGAVFYSVERRDCA